MILRVFACIFTALLLFGVPGAFPQDALPKEPSKETKTANEQPVILGDKILFYLPTESEEIKDTKRSEDASKRIKTIADSTRVKVDSIKTRDLNEPITFIVTGNEILLAVLDHDAVSKGKSRKQLATEYSQVIRTAIEKYRENRSLKQLIYGVLYTFLATIVLIAILILIGKIKHKIDQRIEERFKVWEKGIQIKSVQIVGAGKINDLLKGSIKGIRLILVLVFLYIYLQLELGFFPWTRPFAGQVLGYVLSPLITIGKGFSKNIPNLIFITVLVLLVRYTLKAMKFFFLGIEKGSVKIQGFYPEWAKSTYRLLSFLIIAFCVVIAFPYVPGSDSLAFKGVSVFVGVLFSLGAQSSVSNIIAGFALTYRRAFLVGDRVRIADFAGDVLDTRLQVTILRTVKNEEIIVPNSMILNSHVINYSTKAQERGLILHTAVSIGYDTPWRQVHEMLLMAARKTPGLVAEPEPFVLQKSLDDFYVTYELNVYTDKPEKMTVFYSELHQNILDVFNEYGVQIMSPNYVADRAEPAIVTKEHWYAPPTKPPIEE
ncbi:MAG: mechanosensitive ion channel family protein [Desulfobacteraceae bacterium]|nr:mechanosensitive ion channel family protein [Desulfobacteraceae bacterium]